MYDGKLYVGYLDTSSMLECVGQFVNGNLLTRTPAQWKTQWDYLKALMKAPQETNPDGNGESRHTLAQTIKFSYKFVFKNITTATSPVPSGCSTTCARQSRALTCMFGEDGVNFQTITVDGFGGRPLTTMVCGFRHHRPGSVPWHRQSLLSARSAGSGRKDS